MALRTSKIFVCLEVTIGVLQGSLLGPMIIDVFILLIYYREKYAKDKKVMEEKLSDVMATLAEEEEKAKHLVKLKVI